MLTHKNNNSNSNSHLESLMQQKPKEYFANNDNQRENISIHRSLASQILNIKCVINLNTENYNILMLVPSSSSALSSNHNNKKGN